MPKPVLLVPCTWCATPYVLDLAKRREAEGLPVEYGICPTHRAEREAAMFHLTPD